MHRLTTLLNHLQPRNQQLSRNPCSAKSKPVKVVVTGAAGNIGYAIVFMIAQGEMLGPDQPVELRLLDIPPMEKVLKGLVMELEDGAYPCLRGIIATSDYKTAFEDVEVALLIGAKPRGPGMQRKDLLQANASIFSGQGKALNQHANRNVKVLVVGNPANTNALITMTNAPSLSPENFSAMTRLDQNRAKSLLANKLGVTVNQVKNVIIWGNHSATQFPDVRHGVVSDFPHHGASIPISAAINDEKYLRGEFISTVQNRGAAVIAAREKSSAASAASAALDHIRSWILGSQGEYVSMAVPSDGSYGVPKGIIFSFPCLTANGRYQIVQGLKLDDFSKEKFKLTTDELLQEKDQALNP